MPPSLSPAFRQSPNVALTAALVSVLALALSACSPSSGSAPADAAGETATAAAADKPTQVAARVNRQELTVHQINAVLRLQPQQAGESTQAAGQRVLEQLIDQSLAQQKALSLRLEQQPQVVQQLEAARREVMARAWAEHVVEDLLPATEAQQRRYYDEHPALFAQRKVFQLQDLWVEVPADDRARWINVLGQTPDLGRYTDALRRSQLRFAAASLLRASEQLSAAQLERLSSGKVGDAVVVESPQGLRVWWLVGVRAQALSWQEAQPVIENLLAQQQRAERVREELTALRTQGDVEYVGAFARGRSERAGSGQRDTVVAQPGSASASP